MIGVLFDGIAYGSLLFVVSLGLSVTMGLMNFVNLAHGAFAMAGGYVAVVAMTRLGVPFLAALPLAAMDTRLSLPVLVAWVLDWEEGAMACGVTVSLAGPKMGDWVGRFVSFRGREREEGLPVVLGLTVDTTVSVDLTSGAWR